MRERIKGGVRQPFLEVREYLRSFFFGQNNTVIHRKSTEQRET